MSWVLFLDDSEDRFLSLSLRLIRLGDLLGLENIHVQWAKNYEEFVASKINGRYPYDVIMLDHDLGEGPDGLSCARDLIASPGGVFSIPQVLIHSTNTVRAPIMAEELRAAGFDVTVCSFPQLLDKL